MDPSFGTVTLFITSIYNLVVKFAKLGEDSKKLIKDAKAVQRTAERLKRYLYNHSNEFKAEDIMGLDAIIEECQRTIREAEDAAEELSRTWEHLKQTAKDGEITKMQKKLKDCRKDLLEAILIIELYVPAKHLPVPWSRTNVTK
jgi:predicted  nucleic acid-binding Zn-ribbon protein